VKERIDENDEMRGYGGNKVTCSVLFPGNVRYRRLYQDIGILTIENKRSLDQE
jgi:hypothetical protein